MTMVCLVSDFVSGEDLFGGSDLAMLAARHDVIAVIPQDPFERALPAGSGYMRVRDLELGRAATIDLGLMSREHTPSRPPSAPGRSSRPATAFRSRRSSSRPTGVHSSR